LIAMGASGRGPSVLRQRADTTRRACRRADARVSLAQGYLRVDHGTIVGHLVTADSLE
jgi:hypothetical protein